MEISYILILSTIAILHNKISNEHFLWQIKLYSSKHKSVRKCVSIPKSVVSNKSPVGNRRSNRSGTKRIFAAFNPLLSLPFGLSGL